MINLDDPLFGGSSIEFRETQKEEGEKQGTLLV